MSSINSVRKLQILYFSKKNKKIKNLKNGEKKWPDISIDTYYYSFVGLICRNKLEEFFFFLTNFFFKDFQLFSRLQHE